MLKEYVLGFAFSKDRQYLVLIKKDRPEWQAGKLNGIGGKLEPRKDNKEFNEDPIDAMIREFKEETGVSTEAKDWDYFGKMSFKKDVMGGSANIYLYRMFSEEIYGCHKVETEEVIIHRVEMFLSSYNLMPNLPLLINLALSKEFQPVVLHGK